MSGGVDSSVAAALLKKQGYHVVGAHMKCYNIDGCAAGDAEDARRVAEQLGIPFYVFDFEKEYKQRVVDYMIDGYRKGITPNPDVMCNKEIKFGLFLEKAVSLGADYVATGHYVRLKKGVSRFTLHVSRDQNKDQSYFLWTLTQKQLKHCLFPIGEYTKPQVRVLAKKFGLLTAKKKDSQGVCFLGQISLEDFLKQYIPEQRGEIRDASGVKVGEHHGARYYTLGQRHLGIPNMNLKGKTYYVARKDVKNNVLTVAEKSDAALLTKEVMLSDVNFINSFHAMPAGRQVSRFTFHIFVRVRYRQPLVRATLFQLPVTSHRKLVFDKPQQFVAPGQSAVFYNVRGKMLGGGVIM